MECLKAQKMAKMTQNELQVSSLLNLQFIAADKELAIYVGNSFYTVHKDAKLVTLKTFLDQYLGYGLGLIIQLLKRGSTLE